MDVHEKERVLRLISAINTIGDEIDRRTFTMRATLFLVAMSIVILIFAGTPETAAMYGLNLVILGIMYSVATYYKIKLRKTFEEAINIVVNDLGKPIGEIDWANLLREYEKHYAKTK